MAEKVEHLLAVLRGEVAAAPPEPEPEAEAAAPAVEAGPSASSEEVAALQDRIGELERRLEELAAAPPMEAPPAEAPEGELPPPEGELTPEGLPEGEGEMPPPMEPMPEPPAAPTELSMFLQTRMELMEKKLELAQQEALRANLLLREREDAQRKAQTEVEDLFRNIREQQRAATWDRALRDKYSSAEVTIRQLQERLALAELRMIPAEDVLKHLESEEGRAELERRLRVQAAKLEAKAAQPSPEPAAGPVKPAPPPPEMAGAAPAPGVPAGPTAVDPPPGLESLAAVMGRVADLERRLEESEKLRLREAEKRQLWENDILCALKQTRRTWEKSGGPDLLVEAALESMVDSIKERDELHEEMSGIMAAVQDEPPDSEKAPELRARLAACRRRIEELQGKLGKEMAVVQAWIERNKTG